MDREPRNAASERWRAEIPRWDDESYVRGPARQQLSHDFVREDRRQLIAIPFADAEQYVRQFLAWFEIGDGRPSFRVEEVLAVRGERLVLARMTVSFTGGSGRETLVVAQYDERLGRCQRVITFDQDDFGAAAAEIERLHGAIDGEDGSSPNA